MFAHTKMSFHICRFLCVHTREDTFTIVHMLGCIRVYLHTSHRHGTLLHSHAPIPCHMSNTQGTHAGQMSRQSHILICECSYNRYHRHTQTSLFNSHTPAENTNVHTHQTLSRVHTIVGKHECTYTKLSVAHTHTHLTGDTDVLVLVNPLGVHCSLWDQHLHHARNLHACIEAYTYIHMRRLKEYIQMHTMQI